MICQNKINCTTLKQTTKNERLVLWRPKILYKAGNNFVKCSHSKFSSFLCPQNSSSASFLGHASRGDAGAMSNFLRFRS